MRIAELEAEAFGTPSSRKRVGYQIIDYFVNIFIPVQVSFGQYISPELFDKNLPPDTPVRKGAVPPAELKKGAPVDSPR